jgi:diguanylate cyclase (GGDEF)-like protein/PAS domain S-box-containing protein
MPRLISPLRHFLGIFLPLAGIVLAVALVWQSQERRLHVDGLRRVEQTRVVQEARIMEAVLTSRAVDAGFLADRLGHELTRHPREALEEIRDILWTFAFLKRGYAQVRFLDATGREKIRLENSASGPALLDGEALRDRSGETAFRKAVAIPFGQVYVSRLELEEEDGRVVEPLRPVIHFASPVLGPDYGLAGVLILDLDGELPLARLRQQRVADSDGLVLINPQSHWLLGPSPDMEWGFQLTERGNRALASVWPGVWDVLRRRDQGQFQHDGALYTYATARTDAPAGMRQAVRVIPEEGWILISRLGPERLDPPRGGRFWAMTAGLLALLAAGAGFLAQSRTRREQAAAALRQSEETSRAILNASSDAAYFLFDLKGRILTANAAAEERFQPIVRGGLTGKNFWEIVPPNLAEQRRRLVAFSAERGEPLRFDDRRDGMILDNSLYPVRGEDGAVDRMVLVSRDVTGERGAQDRLLTLSRAVDQSPVMVVITDPKGHIEYVNPRFTQIYGWTLAEVLGATPRVLKSGRHGPEFYAELWSTISDGHDWRGEVCNRARDGREVWERMSISPVLDEEGQLVHFVAVKEDVTERKLAADALAESEEKVRAMSEASQDGLVMLDDQGLVAFWNRAAERMFGYSREEALGRRLHELVTLPEDLDKAKAGFPGFTARGEGAVVGVLNEFTARRRDGATFPVELSVSAFRLRGRWWAVGTARDITDRKLVEAQLREMATTDGLTGIFNRRRFMELADDELGRAHRYGRPVSLIMFDVDHFKKVNDTRGHAAGDKVLRALTAMARETLRGADILGRIGGEEFAVLLPETDLPAATRAAERLRRAAESMNLVADGEAFGITVSLGVALLQEDEILEDFLKRTDQALYKAKQGGRNRVEVG